MGKEIARMADDSGVEVTGIANSADELLARHELLVSSDVAIEFTHPEAAPENVIYCLKSGVPVVCGTTGWYGRLEEIRAVCAVHQGAFFYASNFSIGVNIFFRINRLLAKLMNEMPDYAVQIEETHHIHKKDKPSGTAITLAEGILSEVPRLKGWVSGDMAGKDELPVMAYREDDVPGTHRITYRSSIDDIEICHTAHNRTGFVAGALKAAAWLKSRKGVFTMSDLID